MQRSAAASILLHSGTFSRGFWTQGAALFDLLKSGTP
jgi:hypothetical protein